MPKLRWPPLATVVSLLAVTGSALFILLQFQPGLLFADTTPAGGDMGAHVWGPAYLRDHVLPHGRITGWSPDWYAGFPAYHFYFPLPSLLIVLLDVALPYGVAFKVVTVIGPLALPAACYALGRALRLPFPTPAVMAVAAIPFVFDRFHTIWGGNAAATLAGEFSFAIGLATAVGFLAALARALETGKGRALAGALLAVTGLCHLLPAAFAVVGAGVLLVVRRPDRARWGIVATTGLVGAALSAFWLMPFLYRLPFSNDMGWERTFDYVKNLLPFLRTDDGAAPVTTAHLKVVIPLAVVGVIVGLARRRRGALVLFGIAALAGLGFRFVPSGPIWNARLLPFWYLLVYLLAALAIGELARFVGESFGRVDPLGERVASSAPGVFATVAAAVVTIVFVGLPLGIFGAGRLELPGPLHVPFPKIDTADRNFVPAWAAWNYAGYERKPDYPEYRDVVETMERVGQRHGCGRAMWEYESELNRFGTPMALMLLPMWTDGCIGSMEGLFFESSATVGYHFLNQSEMSLAPSRAQRDLPYRSLDVRRGVEHLQLLGVRYYLALTPDAQAQATADPDLRLVATTKPYDVSYPDGTKPRFWQVYIVEDADLVEPLAFEPAVMRSGADGKEAWLDAAVAWYQDTSRWDVPLAVDGPAEWPRVATPEEAPARRAVRTVRVTNIRESDDRIAFDVDRPGSPVLVKTSYFPNWKVDGARGPWRVTPNLMVVIPTSAHVEMHYGWTPVDLVAIAITALGLAAAVVLARRGGVKLPIRPSPPKPPPLSEWPAEPAAEPEPAPV